MKAILQMVAMMGNFISFNMDMIESSFMFILANIAEIMSAIAIIATQILYVIVGFGRYRKPIYEKRSVDKNKLPSIILNLLIFPVA